MNKRTFVGMIVLLLFMMAISAHADEKIVGPWNLDALSSLGESLFLSGHRDDARLAFGRVLRFDPDHVGALYFEGVLLAEAKQFDLALDRWSNVIALEPAGDFARRARRDTRTALDLQRIFSSREARILGAA